MLTTRCVPSNRESRYPPVAWSHLDDDKLARALGGAVRPVHVDAVDEDHAQIAILGAARGGHIGIPAGREHLCRAASLTGKSSCRRVSALVSTKVSAAAGP